MKLNEKIYAQLANRVYDREDIRNKMTLPEGVTELEWYDDDPESGFPPVFTKTAIRRIFCFSGCLTDAFPLRKTTVRQPESYPN